MSTPDAQLLPEDLEAEKYVLGGLMLAPDRFGDVAEWLRPEHFSREWNVTIYRCMQRLAERGSPLEMTAVVSALLGQGGDEQLAAYCSGLPDTVPSPENIAYFGRIVREMATRRAVAQQASRLRAMACDRTIELDEITAYGERIGSAAEPAAGRDWIGGDALFAEAVAEMAPAPVGANPGARTGLADLDRLVGAMRPGALWVLAARPAMGKTALALNIAAGVAEAGHGVGILELEMVRGELASRLLCGEARVSMGRARDRDLTDLDRRRIDAARARLASMPIAVCDRAGLTLADIRARARALKAQEPGLALIVLDHLGLVQPAPEDQRATRERQISQITGGLKRLAKELEVTVLALSQLNRGVEARLDKRPLLSDLRDSGSIEQDADMVMLLYRDEYYVRDSPDQGIAELNVAKQRGGSTGPIRLHFDGELCRFSSLYEGGVRP